MNIAILAPRARYEAFTLPGQEPPGTMKVFIDQSRFAEDTLAKAPDTEVLLVDAGQSVPGSLIRQLPKLKLIHSEGVGYSGIDCETARQQGVFVCNNRAVNAGPVAEHAVLLMLAVLRRLSEGYQMVREGRFGEARTRFITEGVQDLSACQVGIYGLGAIGQELAKRLKPFGCALCYYDVFRAPPELEAELGVHYLEPDELLARSDILTLHVPATAETEQLIRRETIQKMKPGAILINCARGSVVNSADLAEAVLSGRLFGAGLDTVDPEPLPADSPLLQLPSPWRDRIIITPHLAGTTQAAFFASWAGLWANVTRLQNGERPVNIVNGL